VHRAVQGISGDQDDAFNADMHEDAIVAIPATVMFTYVGKAESKAVKDRKKCIAYYAIALK
jgi:hypothetical protein